MDDSIGSIVKQARTLDDKINADIIKGFDKILSETKSSIRPTNMVFANRAEAKRFKKYGDKNGKAPTPNLNTFIHLYTLSFILSMDSCDVGKEKVVEVMEKLYETAECMISGHINQRDVENMAKDIYGIDFDDAVKNRIYVNGEQLIRV